MADPIKLVKNHPDYTPILLQQHSVNALTLETHRSSIGNARTERSWADIKRFFDYIADVNRIQKGVYKDGLYIFYGAIFYGGYYPAPICVVCKDKTDNLIVFIDSSYVENHKTHLDYIKHGIYKLGVKRGKYVLKSSAEMLMMFTKNLNFNLSDLTPEKQLEKSSNFIKWLRNPEVKEVNKEVQESTPIPILKTVPKSKVDWNSYFTNEDDEEVSEGETAESEFTSGQGIFAQIQDNPIQELPSTSHASDFYARRIDAIVDEILRGSNTTTSEVVNSEYSEELRSIDEEFNALLNG